MKINQTIILIWALALLSSCTAPEKSTEEQAKDSNSDYVQLNYDKQEVYIDMRDGTKLFTSIYSPKDKSKTYPIIMQRTPYSVGPYGKDKMRTRIAPSPTMMKEGYIVVYQDVRGRYMSEGVYDNMRAYIPNKTDNSQVDESSDTYDTIEWLVNNVENNNGKVGTWGISYPGYYSTYSVIDAHPALKAASPQAAIGDFFFDDFHHNGAFLLSYFRAIPVFGTYKDQPTDKGWYSIPDLGTQDQYQFFLDAGPLKNLNSYFENYEVDSEDEQAKKDFFWNEIVEHPNYDELWQSKGLVQHLSDVKPSVATMFVIGEFDAEDLYGPLSAYKKLEKDNPGNYNTMVFGPWSHGQWSRNQVRNAVGNYYFGDSISLNYQKNVESKFFSHFLKGDGDAESGLPEAYVYDSGKKQWNSFEQWPPKEAKSKMFYLGADGSLNRTKKAERKRSFVSDLSKPVPYSEDIKTVFTPRKYMTDDQRFAARRPDVLVYETPVLEEDLTVIGELVADLKVATTGSAADWIVKIVDVHPADYEENNTQMQGHLKMSNYHMMVRSEVMRGRFRDSFSDPKPFTPGEKTQVVINLQDIHHTFKKGHKLQVQIQSTWFPLIDLNPQTYVDNIYKADEKDFKNQTHTVFSSSSIEFKTLD